MRTIFTRDWKGGCHATTIEMAVTSDIVATWRRPRVVIADKTRAVREDRALAVLIGACVLIFVAQLPGLARAAHFAPEVPLDARMGGALRGIRFVVPLAAYVLAAVSHLIAKVLGGKGTGFAARMALFWALLAAAPLFLLHGLLRGFLGDTVAVTGAGVLMLLGFLTLWMIMLHRVEAG